MLVKGSYNKRGFPNLDALKISWKQKYRGLGGFLRTIYKMPIKELVKKAVTMEIAEETPESIALLLLRGTNYGIDRADLGDYLTE